MEERIREIEFGILDGLTGEGIQEEFPQEAERRKREGKYWYRPAGGESRPDVALRVQSFLGTLTRDYRKKSVLVVCHSVVVLIFRRLLERWNEDEYLKIDREQDVLNCSMTAYRYDAKMGKLMLDLLQQGFSPGWTVAELDRVLLPRGWSGLEPLRVGQSDSSHLIVPGPFSVFPPTTSTVPSPRSVAVWPEIPVIRPDMLPRA